MNKYRVQYTKRRRQVKYTVTLFSRCTAENLEVIKSNARIACMSVCRYLREKAVGKPIHHKVDLIVTDELRRIGGLLKHLYSIQPSREIGIMLGEIQDTLAQARALRM